MLALVASQLRYKVEAGLGGLGGAGDGLEKGQRNGKTYGTVVGTETGTRRKPIWVDVRLLIRTLANVEISHTADHRYKNRSVGAQAGISKPWPSLSTSLNSSRLFT